MLSFTWYDVADASDRATSHTLAEHLKDVTGRNGIMEGYEIIDPASECHAPTQCQLRSSQCGSKMVCLQAHIGWIIVIHS
jgi:hypothetical protein